MVWCVGRSRCCTRQRIQTHLLLMHIVCHVRRGLQVVGKQSGGSLEGSGPDVHVVITDSMSTRRTP